MVALSLTLTVKSAYIKRPTPVASPTRDSNFSQTNSSPAPTRTTEIMPVSFGNSPNLLLYLLLYICTAVPGASTTYRVRT